MKRNYTEQDCYDEMEKERSKAEDILKDKNKFDKFLKELEIKLRKFPRIGNQLADLPVMISLVKDFATGKYKVVPVKSIVYMIMALLYFISPLDLVPDFIWGAGIADDATVLMLALKNCHGDIEAYREWKDNIV